MSACERCASPWEEGDLRCGVCGLLAPEAGAPPVAKAEVRVVRCVECGAAVRWVAEVSAARCAFCGAETEVELASDPAEQPQGRLPFRVSPAQAEAALRDELGKWALLRPGDLAARATLQRVHRLWWCAWAVDAEASVTWSADTERGAQKSRWAPRSGAMTTAFRDVVVSASRGLSDDEAAALSGAYDLSGAEPLDDELDAAHERFELPRSAARKRVLEALETLAPEAVRPTLGASRVRNLTAVPLLRGLVTRRLLLPAYVLTYAYREKRYRFVVHGQDARVRVVDAPWSLARAVALALAALAVVALLVWWGGQPA